MEFAWYIYLLVVLGGAVSGAINTLAGNGSLVALPLLIFVGLPATVANGTNRIGSVFQCATGVATFRRGGRLRTEGSAWFIVPTLLGALLGAAVAARMTPKQMEIAIGAVMVAMMLVVLVNPKHWLREHSEVAEGRPKWWLLLIFFAIGAYGGFIHVGVSVLMLSALVLGAGYNLVEGNAVKVLVVGIFTAGALLVFILSDQVHWGIGLLMAVGQVLGSWAAARFAMESENAATWVRRLLLAIVAVSALKFFGVFGWALELLR
jgi:uncharacterized membrane protein YfcA